MKTDAVVIRFARDGVRDGVALEKDRDYSITVDEGPWETFRSPWDQKELDEIVEVLRNNDPARDTGIRTLDEIGRQLGASLAQVPSLASRLGAAAGGRLVVFWQLDYPELARVPWELASWSTPPHQHILLDPNVSFVRTVPLYRPQSPTQWPTGEDRALRLLFIWGETAGSTVPHAEHLARLEGCCDERGVDLTFREVRDATDLTNLVSTGHFDFVHVLAHGIRTESGKWGLRFADERIAGAQLARALQSGAAPPAMVTLAACDSANEVDSSFGSVAYELHAHGIPMVLGSQFRLRKSVSTEASALVYDSVLDGQHPLEVLSGLRRQLSPNSDESWSNDVLYTSYTLDALDGAATIALQQAALRRARVVARREATGESASSAIAELERQTESLQRLANSGFDLAETCGLLGSMATRIAHLRSDPPDAEDLRDALEYYERGLRSDLNSLYCAVNAIHLSLLLGERTRAEKIQPIANFLVETQLRDDTDDYWAWASAGELAVYTGQISVAEESYREFVRRERRAVADRNRQADELGAAARQLRAFVALEPDVDEVVITAAAAALDVVDGALKRLESR